VQTLAGSLSLIDEITNNSGTKFVEIDSTILQLSRTYLLLK